MGEARVPSLVQEAAGNYVQLRPTRLHPVLQYAAGNYALPQRHLSPFPDRTAPNLPMVLFCYYRSLTSHPLLQDAAGNYALTDANRSIYAECDPVSGTGVLPNRLDCEDTSRWVVHVH